MIADPISLTARWTAAARAVESAREDCLFRDPYAEVLAGPEGFALKQQMEKARNLGSEFERMAKIGNVAPDIWMKQATGAPVGPHALLSATEKALAIVTK